MLENITVGGAKKRPLLAVYGPGGVGKTTFATSAPAPVVMPVEEGLGLIKVPALPRPTSYDEVMAQLQALASEPHEYQTLVIDSLDQLEPLIFEQAAGELGAESIMDEKCKRTAFGKGYKYADRHWLRIFDGIDYLRSERGMLVILIAHNEIRTYNDPMSDSYDRHQIKLQKRGAAIIQERVDALLFADFKRHVVKDDNDRARGVGTGERVLYTEERPSHQAKNRYGLPPEIPLAWRDFSAAMAAAIKSTTKEEDTNG